MKVNKWGVGLANQNDLLSSLKDNFTNIFSYTIPRQVTFVHERVGNPSKSTAVLASGPFIGIRRDEEQGN